MGEQAERIEENCWNVAWEARGGDHWCCCCVRDLRPRPKLVVCVPWNWQMTIDQMLLLMSMQMPC